LLDAKFLARGTLFVEAYLLVVAAAGYDAAELRIRPGNSPDWSIMLTTDVGSARPLVGRWLASVISQPQLLGTDTSVDQICVLLPDLHQLIARTGSYPLAVVIELDIMYEVVMLEPKTAQLSFHASDPRIYHF
jgi:hypothetical protein